jgi:hypothetical protein
VILVTVAVRHVLLATTGASDGASRQWLFAVVNVGLAGVLVVRHRAGFWPALCLGILEVGTHGLDLSKSFLGSAPLDVPSLAVCLFYPTLVTILYLERADAKEKEEEAKYEKKREKENEKESASE